jgi:hypothetical protein
MLASNDVGGIIARLDITSTDNIIIPTANMFMFVVMTSYYLPSFHLNTFLKC